MFRKILIATVASLSLLSPFALPVVTEAREAVAHHHTYRVYYRSCGAEPWRFAGTYRFRQDAFREVRHLRTHGFEAVIR